MQVVERRREQAAEVVERRLEQAAEISPARFLQSRLLEPFKEKARMLKNHLPHILTYFKYRISNAVAEGLNSKIQTVKTNAKGYRSFDGFRNSILFYCGGLDMKPRGYTNL